jgi:Fe-S-cluster containining protein
VLFDATSLRYTATSMPRAKAPAKPRPLLAREGAHFSCFGDGLCCTDIHVLGLLTKSEVRDLRQRRKLSVFYSEDIGGDALRTSEGRCLFLQADDRCHIHAVDGADAKPVGCRRFPYGLVSTPHGGRVTTEHRCPCRTLGERPTLSLSNAEASLRDRSGRLEVDFDVAGRIELQHKQRVSFDVYVEIERKLIARLNAGERAEQVLAARALPRLENGWPRVAVEHIETRDGSAGGEAYTWFGDALLHLSAGHAPPKRKRPWRAAYERAMARSETELTPDQIYNDWIADEIWMFRWYNWGPFDLARAELATRLKIARLIQDWIENDGVKPMQAAAEAVMICELIAGGNEWPEAVASIAIDPSPADPIS